MTDEEIQEKINFLIKRFQESISRLNSFESILNKYETISNQLSDKLQVETSHNLSLKNQFNVFSESSSIKLDDNSRKLNDVRISVDTLSNNNKEMKDSSEKIKHSIDDLSNRMIKMHNVSLLLAPISSFDSVKRLVDEHHVMMEDQRKQISLIKLECDQKISIHLSKLIEIQAQLDLIKKEINDSSKNYLTFQKEYNFFKTSIDYSFQELKLYFDKSIIDKISAIPKPLIPSLDEAKKDTQSKLEPIQLDAKNAHLRSVNTEAKVHILEKKLEQLQLLVNKLQLQG